MSERVIPILDARTKRGVKALPTATPLAGNRLVVPGAQSLTPAADAPVADTLDRPLHDLRISVTDRCNFRCVYCMPKEVFGPDHPYLARNELLSFEEITRVARVFRGLGVKKIRLTGGEPLLRKNIERLVEMLAGLGLDLAMTTNGALLGRKARSLRDAGLSRLTVSLDALDDAAFRATNDVDFPVSEVLEGIEAAAAAGFSPVKINMVVKHGLNEDQILPMARHFRHSGHILRFIEYMDVGASNGWRMDEVVSAKEIVRRINAEMPIETVEAGYRGEVAERWRYKDGAGELGVIASVTQAFCRDCTRLRLSTEGMLYTCLFASEGYDLRALIRPGRGKALPDEAIADTVAAIWRGRGDRYSELRTAQTPGAGRERIEMSYIGG